MNSSRPDTKMAFQLSKEICFLPRCTYLNLIFISLRVSWYELWTIFNIKHAYGLPYDPINLFNHNTNSVELELDMIDEEAQADLPENHDEQEIKIRPYERIKLHPKVPVEPSAFGKGKNFSRPWILQDGREISRKGSEMRDSYREPKKSAHGEGIRRQMLTDFFWEQMLEEVIEELSTSQPVMEYCTEQNANYIKENFEPRDLAVPADKNMHLKYPLYGTGSSAITYYSEKITKSGPGEILEKFRRSQYFTKPMEERMDNGWVL